MDSSSSTKKSTDPCSFEIPDCYTCPDSLLKDEFPSSGSSLTDTVVPETPWSLSQSLAHEDEFPSSGSSLTDTVVPETPWSVSQSLAYEVVPKRPLADEVVPEIVLGDVFVPTLTTSEYKAILEEYKERNSWYSKNKFSGQNHYKWDRSSSSPAGDSSLADKVLSESDNEIISEYDSSYSVYLPSSQESDADNP